MQQKALKITMVIALLSLSILIPAISVSAKKELWILEPFSIDGTGNSGILWSDCVTQPWCTGSGTEEDPYVIKNVMINGEGSSFCLAIMYSAVFFIIKDCIFYNTKPPNEERNAGLALVATQNGKICNNKFLSNGWKGLGLAAGVALLYCSNMVIQKNEVCNNAGPGIYLEYSYGNLIIQNHCSKNEGAGISVGWSDSNQFIDNKCQKNELGIILFNECTDNSLVKNTCSDNEQYGIQIWIQSNYNRLTDNYCTKNLLSGILLGASNGIIVSNNRCSKNGESGISIIGLYDITAENNIIYNNYVDNNLKGISLSRVVNNDIFMNTIKNNAYGVILDWDCYDNLVYHNNFIHNTVNAWDATFNSGPFNLWYHPYMLEGNYWSDYSGDDLDDDGIGDTLLPASRLDYYPFMEKNGWEYKTPVEEEIIAVMNDLEANRLGGFRTVDPSQTSYLILGLGQAFSERINREWSPPYTVRVWFDDTEIFFQGSFWFFEEDNPAILEPVTWQYFYLIIPPFALFDEPFNLDINGEEFSFNWQVTFFSYDEQQVWDLTSYFYF